jgi:hypothetical protein
VNVRKLSKGNRGLSTVSSNEQLRSKYFVLALSFLEGFRCETGQDFEGNCGNCGLRRGPAGFKQSVQTAVSIRVVCTSFIIPPRNSAATLARIPLIRDPPLLDSCNVRQVFPAMSVHVIDLHLKLQEDRSRQLRKSDASDLQACAVSD